MESAVNGVSVTVNVNNNNNNNHHVEDQKKNFSWNNNHIR